ncbi:MAG: type VII secretion protein EssC [Clostridia bacterium]|nr:type VII secretion protein EssC [Clostridia bacterium]
MSEDILLHVYFEDTFREIDLSKFGKSLISVGKDEANDIVINSPNLENRHFILKSENSQWIIYSQSASGVLCNGKPIDKKVISSDDIFVMGNSGGTASRVAIMIKNKNQYDHSFTKFDIRGVSSIKLGKRDSNHIIYTFQLVSGEHAEIFMSAEGEYYIKDLNSTNGVFLNGRRISESLLKPGDVIHICGYKLMYDRGYLSVCNVGSGVAVNGLKQFKTRKSNIGNIIYPYFQRSPRLKPEMPKGEVEISNPPSAPTKPNISWLSIFLPPAIMIGVSIATTILSKRNSTYVFITMAMTLGMVVVSIINYSSQKKKFKTDAGTRNEKYMQLIHNHRRELQYMREQQRNGLQQIHPDIKGCIDRAENRDRRLWERTPFDDDFLLIRVGEGSEPFKVKVKTSKPDINMEQDPLKEEPHKLAGEFTTVHDVPVCLSVYNSGTVGLIGVRREMIQTARAMAIQIAAHHSYDEVKIIAIFPSEETSEWDWIRWLPHVWDDNRQQRFIANDSDSAHQMLSSLYDILKQRDLSSGSKQTYGSDKGIVLPYLVFFLADPRLLENEAIMSYLAQNNQRLGISSIFLYDRIEMLPRDCQAIIESGSKMGRMIQKNIDSSGVQFNPDKVTIDQAEFFARKLSPLRVKQIASSGNLPSMVTMLGLLEVKKFEDLNVKSRWKSSEPYRSLAAPLGIRLGGEKLLLDLHEKAHGPHGLVAGTTGSGKSEILQSYIVSMAVNFHPHDVAFVLIDYKGGGMANAFIDLPHLVGTITNLGGNQTTRALVSIKSELKRRQALFGEYGVNHIDAYQKLYKKGEAREPLPHLIIIADEFAELKSEQPEFMVELVSAARVGRSLGVHLILATQKPAGVVNDQIWSNSRFRLCLKVQEAADSQEVIKRPDAANIKLPGRAYLQVGHNEIFELFQSAWSGAGYEPNAIEEDTTGNDIFAVELDGGRRQLFAAAPKRKAKSEFTQLQVMVKHLRDTAQNENIKRLNGPWLPPLPEQITLSELTAHKNYGWNGQKWLSSESWLNPVVGIIDNPSKQSQYPLSINLGGDGHFAVFGGPGSGKTTLVQTLITSLAMGYTPDDVNMYILDFGSRTLNMFAELPHVGGVVMMDENVKLQKLSRFLLKELDTRKRLFSDRGVSSLPAFREATHEALPALVVVVDNFPALMELYSDMEDLFVQLSREGGNLGVHLVLTSNAQAGIRFRVINNIKLAVALQMADKTDYIGIVGRTNGLEPSPTDGRGLVRDNPPLEFQTALAAKGDNEAERTLELKSLFRTMSTAWTGDRAKPIPIMPETVYFNALLARNDVKRVLSQKKSSIPFALDDEDLSPVYLDIADTPNFLVTGQVQCGKTSFLRTWLMGMAMQYSPEELEIYLIDSNSMGLFPLKQLPHVRAYISDSQQLSETVDSLKSKLEERKAELNEARKSSDGVFNEKDLLTGFTTCLIVADDFNDFMQMAQPSAKEFIETIIRRERKLGFNIAMCGMSSDIGSSWDNLAKAFKEMQTGILLSNASEQQVFSLRLPLSETSKQLQFGEGYFIGRGRSRKIKCAYMNDNEMKEFIRQTINSFNKNQA